MELHVRNFPIHLNESIKEFQKLEGIEDKNKACIEIINRFFTNRKSQFYIQELSERVEILYEAIERNNVILEKLTKYIEGEYYD